MFFQLRLVVVVPEEKDIVGSKKSMVFRRNFCYLGCWWCSRSWICWQKITNGVSLKWKRRALWWIIFLLMLMWLKNATAKKKVCWRNSKFLMIESNFRLVCSIFLFTMEVTVVSIKPMSTFCCWSSQKLLKSNLRLQNQNLLVSVVDFATVFLSRLLLVKVGQQLEQKVD